MKRENPPHTPSKERSEKEVEEVSSSNAGAREENSSMPADKLVESCQCSKRPTLKQVLDWASLRNRQRYTDALIREWYTECEDSDWKDSKGYLIKNWKRHLTIWRNYHDLNAKIQDPDRIPDARVQKVGPAHHADNWRPTRKEDLEDVL